MPYLPSRNGFYKINYIEFKEHFMKFQIFKRKSIQKNYIDRWISYLEKIDRQYQCAFDNNDETYLRRNCSENNEVFPQEIIFGKIIVMLQFQITNIKSSIQGAETITIPISKFKEGEGFHHTKTDGELYKLKEIPTVIIAEFYNSPLVDGYVIDGNHRLTSAIKNNYSKVNALILKEKDLSHLKEAFVTEWDYAFYIFINELNIIFNNLARQTVLSKDILEKSYLSIDSPETYKLDNYFLINNT